MKITKLKIASENEGSFYKENLSVYISELQLKVNEIIDFLEIDKNDTWTKKYNREAQRKHRSKIV